MAPTGITYLPEIVCGVRIKRQTHERGMSKARYMCAIITSIQRTWDAVAGLIFMILVVEAFDDYIDRFLAGSGGGVRRGGSGTPSPWLCELPKCGLAALEPSRQEAVGRRRTLRTHWDARRRTLRAPPAHRRRTLRWPLLPSDQAPDMADNLRSGFSDTGIPVVLSQKLGSESPPCLLFPVRSFVSNDVGN